MNSQIITNAKIYWPAFFWNMSVNVIRKNFKLFLQVINVTIIDEKQILKMLHNYFYLIENYVIIKKLIWFKIKYNARALARKLKLMMFSWNWDIRQVCTKDHHHCWQQEIFFLLQHVECYKMSSWERNISKHDIIQHKQITYEKYFFSLFIINLVGIWFIKTSRRYWVLQWLTCRQLMQICHGQCYFKCNLNWTIRLFFILKKAVCNTLMLGNTPGMGEPFLFCIKPKFNPDFNENI